MQAGSPDCGHQSFFEYAQIQFYPTLLQLYTIPLEPHEYIACTGGKGSYSALNSIEFAYSNGLGNRAQKALSTSISVAIGGNARHNRGDICGLVVMCRRISVRCQTQAIVFSGKPPAYPKISLKRK